VAPFVSTHSQIRAAILRYYHKVGEGPAAGAVPAATIVAQLDEEPTTVVGEELPARAAARKASATVARDLDFLFGRTDEEEPVEKLERKFWTLLRLLTRKGLVSREEFLAELDDSEP
jgi:hypothetical protein